MNAFARGLTYGGFYLQTTLFGISYVDVLIASKFTVELYVYGMVEYDIVVYLLNLNIVIYVWIY